MFNLICYFKHIIIFFEFKFCVQLLVNYKICKFSEFLWPERYSWLFLVWSSLQRLAARCEKNKNEQKLKLPFCHFALGMLAWLLALLCSYQCQTLLSAWRQHKYFTILANHEAGIWFCRYDFCYILIFNFINELWLLFRS